MRDFRLRRLVGNICALQGVVIPYRRFGTTYRSHLRASRNTEDGTDSLSGNVGKELTAIRSVIFQKSADFITILVSVRAGLMNLLRLDKAPTCALEVK